MGQAPQVSAVFTPAHTLFTPAHNPVIAARSRLAGKQLAYSDDIFEHVTAAKMTNQGMV